MLARCGEYHEWGVPFCRVIDPVKRAAWECHAVGEPVRGAGTLRAGQIAFSLEEGFSSIDQ